MNNRKEGPAPQREVLLSLTGSSGCSPEPTPDCACCRKTGLALLENPMGLIRLVVNLEWDLGLGLGSLAVATGNK